MLDMLWLHKDAYFLHKIEITRADVSSMSKPSHSSRSEHQSVSVQSEASSLLRFDGYVAETQLDSSGAANPHYF